MTLWSVAWDHLRVCGADFCHDWDQVHAVGSPPRVRSRRFGIFPGFARIGITSACAEQTDQRRRACSSRWDHLRVCGADPADNQTDWQARGSPPRVRSRPGGQPDRLAGQGITSACAEQTAPLTRTTAATRDHLRVCGADVRYSAGTSCLSGSPPRVRSRHPVAPPVREPTGITSACAEQTCPPNGPWSSAWDHLRVCGADGMARWRAASDSEGVEWGSPPRVRSRPTIRWVTES